MAGTASDAGGLPGRTISFVVAEMHVDDEDYRGMREYSRVDSYLPLEIRRVPLEQKPAMRSRTSVESVLTDFQSFPEIEENSALSECLKILNAKLDTILNMLTLQCTEYSCLKFAQVNISAGGLSASITESLEPGETVEIRLMLPSQAYVVFYIYGEVIRVEQDSSGLYLTSVGFTEIDEDIRDRVAKHVFERQREILRKLKRRQ
jgi:hypothetical protein